MFVLLDAGLVVLGFILGMCFTAWLRGKRDRKLATLMTVCEEALQLAQWFETTTMEQVEKLGLPQDDKNIKITTVVYEHSKKVAPEVFYLCWRWHYLSTLADSFSKHVQAYASRCVLKAQTGPL